MRWLSSNFIVFFICLVIAVFLWLLLKLSGEYSHTIYFPIKFNYKTENKILIYNSDSIISLSVKSKEFNFMSYFFPKKKNFFYIDLNKINQKKTGNFYLAKIPLSKFRYRFSEFIDAGDEIINIIPDTICIKLQDVFFRKVPVKLNLSINFQNQYQYYHPVNIIPDSVVVSGVKTDVDKINYISTEVKTLNNINSNQRLILNLSCPEKIFIEPKFVEAIVFVERYTEAQITVPIKVINNFRKNSVRIFPDKVKITYHVAFKDYRKLNNSMFEASFDFLKARKNNSNKLKIEIKTKPDFIRITNVNPVKAEYIILNSSR